MDLQDLLHDDAPVTCAASARSLLNLAAAYVRLRDQRRAYIDGLRIAIDRVLNEAQFADPDYDNDVIPVPTTLLLRLVCAPLQYDFATGGGIPVSLAAALGRHRMTPDDAFNNATAVVEEVYRDLGV